MFFTGVYLSTQGGMRGCSQRGAYMVAPRGLCVVALGVMHGCCGGCAWLLWGDAWLLLGGRHGCSWGGHVWDMMRYRDMINEQAVPILLECILVALKFYLHFDHDIVDRESCNILGSFLMLWILYSRGRVWVHHLSLSSGHHQNGILQWPFLFISTVFIFTNYLYLRE